MTEERYIGVVAGFWIIGWSIVFTVRRNAGIRWIPASLAIMAVAIAFGPWSAGAVSERSQIDRVVAILKGTGLWRGGSARAAEHKTELPHATGTSLRSTIDYLIHMHGKGSVQGIFAHVVPLQSWYEPHWNATNAVMDGLEVAVANEDESRYFTRTAGTGIDITGFRRAWPLQNIYGRAGSPWSPQKFGDLRVGVDHGVLKVAIGRGFQPAWPLVSNHR